MVLHMKLTKKFTSLSMKTGIGVIATKIAGLAKISVIIGSRMALLSATNIVTPLIGAWGGMKTSIGVCAINIAIRYLLFGLYGLHILADQIL